MKINLTIGRKIFYGFWVLILLSLSFLVISYPSLKEIDLLSSMVIPLEMEMNSSQEYNEITKDLESKIELYLMVPSQDTSDEIISITKQLDEFVLSAKEDMVSDSLKGILGIVKEISKTTRALMHYVGKRGAAYETNLQILSVSKLFDEFSKVHKTLQKENLRKLRIIVEREKNIVSKVLNIFFILEISIILFGSLTAFFLTRLIIKNLSKLQKATQDIGNVNFEARIDIDSNDEIGQLAKSFNSMTQALRKKTVSKNYLDTIIDSMVNMLVVIDSNMKIVKVNKAICEALKYKEEDLMGESIRKIILFKKGLISYVEFEKQVKKGTLTNHEMHYRTEYGFDIPVLFSASLMDTEGEGADYIICSAQDITIHKLAEEKEKEVVEMKAKLNSMVSYDLRTHMAAIYTGVYLMLEGKSGALTDKQKHILDIAQRNLDKVLHLINNFLDFRNLESDSFEFSMKKLDINRLIKDVSKEMKPLIEGKALKLEFELTDKLLKIECDRERISQVLVNLISNAINSTGKGTITIATLATEEGVRIAVADTGGGILKKDKDKIFFSFEHSYTIAQKGIKSIGLGLAVCKEIIEKHNGKIWVDSEPRKGSTFYFSLPNIQRIVT